MKYEYWFANLKGISNKRKIEMRQKLRRIKELYYMEEKEMEKLGIKEPERKILIDSIKTWNPENEYKKVLEKGVQCIPFVHRDYPLNLKEIHSPPYMLYVKGRLPERGKKTVAMVGARECSTYGAVITRDYAEALAHANVQIISGMARGIDSVSQRGALQAGGASFAVLGCGVDICYPEEEFGLYMELAEKGGILSEYPIGTRPLRQNFPARNRIISGISDAVLVMEAKERSGSLITADLALEQGKDVYALPGPVNSMLSRGCNSLIKQGAGILLSPEELLLELGILPAEQGKKEGEQKILLESMENLVYSCLDLQPQNLGELVRRTKLAVPDLLDILVRLEFMGIVKEVSKNYYVKLK